MSRVNLSPLECGRTANDVSRRAMSNVPTCPLCHSQDETVLWSDEHCRVVRVTGAEAALYPGFCRVIWHDHISEMTDLSPTARAHLLRVVLATEQALRTLLAPDKINLASLGNQVPHLHWHVIPRYRDDAHFPAPIWAAARQDAPVAYQRPLVSDPLLTQAIENALTLSGL